ncbi:hypothetical protein LNKW23_18450 [Paralimibaculum aggregatum]|uniref:Uncharacterized protein n=1 Tax=Paralimibaculum aggregatum TaxID=3036245 RepID=A0ABQ6LI15_9RHOB|nr:hypothetical protein LNKW23_18450 [Limibaculum sp. NKW23]
MKRDPHDPAAQGPVPAPAGIRETLRPAAALARAGAQARAGAGAAMPPAGAPCGETPEAAS